MLEIGSEKITVDDVTVFSDKNDPLQYYYVPLIPKLSIEHDKSSGFRIPQLQLIKFKSSNVQGGMLNLEVELDLQDDQIQSLRKAIRKENNVDDTLRLNPVRFDDGYAKLVVRGKDYDETKELGYGKLTENNHLSFHTNLDIGGAIAIEKALQGEETPIVIECLLNFFEESDLKRTVAPQIHLKELLNPLLNSSFDSSKLVTRLDLEDPFFKGRRLKLSAVGDFESKNIDSIKASMNYDGAQKTVVLDKENREAEVHWPGKMKDGKMIMPVSISYTIQFKHWKNGGWPSHISSEAEITHSDHYIINPNDHLRFIFISFLAVDISWDNYSSVEIRAEYSDDEHGISSGITIVIDAENTERVWDLFVIDPSKTTFKYKLIYKSKVSTDIETPWKETYENIIFVRSPSTEN